MKFIIKNIIQFTCLSFILTAFNGCINESDGNCLKVSYNLNASDTEGSAPVDSRRYAENSLVTVLGTDATRPNHTFTGWNTKADGTGTPFLPGDTFRIETDVTLYAQWSNADLFTVTYDPNGGTGGSSDEMNANSIITIKTTEDARVERTGFTFTNWNTEADGSGTTYLPGDEFEVISNVTFYAQWEAIPEVQVIYSPNGLGGGVQHIDFVLSGSEYTVRLNTDIGIARPDYNFVGWNTASDGSGTTYQPGNVIVITEDIILYAQWQYVGSAYYNVYYIANFGTGSYSAINIPAGSIYIVRDPADIGISHIIFRFLSWNTASNGSGTSYNPGDAITVNGDVILYAQWGF